MEVQKINLDKIVLDPNQPRGKEGRRKFEDLVTDLKEHGQLYPVILTPFYKSGDSVVLGSKALERKETKYWMLDGERRVRAAQALNWETIEATIKTDIDFLEMLEIQFVANTKRIQIALEEMALAVKRFKEEYSKNNPKGNPLQRLQELGGFSYTYYRAADIINSANKKVKRHIYETQLIPGNFVVENQNAVRGQNKIGVRAVREGFIDAYVEEADKGKKHSVLLQRALKSEARRLAEDEGYEPVEKREIAKMMIESLWDKEKDEEDKKGNVLFYQNEIDEWRKRVMRWNIKKFTRKECDILAAKLIELNDAFREKRRLQLGHVGKRRI